MMIVLVGTISTSIVATVVFSEFFIDEQLDGLSLKGQAVVRLIADNVAPAVDFDDPDSADAILAGLVSDDDFEYAAIVKPDGAIFRFKGSFGKSDRFLADADETRVAFRNDRIHIAHPIRIRDRTAAVVLLGFSLQRIHKASVNIRYAGIGAGLFLAIAFTLYFSIAMGRTVILPIERFKVIVQRLGQGDLHLATELREAATGPREIVEIQDALARAIEAFSSNLQAIRRVATQLLHSAENLDRQTKGLRSSANEQAAAVTQSTSAMEEATQTGTRTKEAAGQILETAKRSQVFSDSGKQAVDKSSSEVKGIKHQVDVMVEAVNRLDVMLNEVDAPVASVTDVAASSHLLAINASIEAAKAGEAGSGFAIVAQEVRKLAHQSKTATEEVRSTLRGIQAGVSELAELSRASIERTDRGIASITHTGKVIENLGVVIGENSSNARQIAGAISQQVVGFNQITTAHRQVLELAQNNLRSIEDLKKLGEVLTVAASEMQEHVLMFKLE